MKIHVLVEGPSEAAFVEPWARRLLRGHDVKAYPHQGKGRLPRTGERFDPRSRGLLYQLPSKLRALGRSLDPRTDRVLVLVDADNDSCVELRRQLVDVLSAIEQPPRVLFRIAIEELEAFYLGDLNALRRVYPEHDGELARQYVPDSICGTAERFGRVIGDDGMNKVDWAKALGPRLTTSAARSRSPSFRKLVSGLSRLVQVSAKPKSRRRRRHPAKGPHRAR